MDLRGVEQGTEPVSQLIVGRCRVVVILLFLPAKLDVFQFLDSVFDALDVDLLGGVCFPVSLPPTSSSRSSRATVKSLVGRRSGSRSGLDKE